MKIPALSEVIVDNVPASKTDLQFQHVKVSEFVTDPLLEANPCLGAVYGQGLRAFTELEKVAEGNPEIEKFISLLGMTLVRVSISPDGKSSWVPIKDLGVEEREIVTRGTNE
jgi:hypothetical protein